MRGTNENVQISLPPIPSANAKIHGLWKIEVRSLGIRRIYSVQNK